MDKSRTIDGNKVWNARIAWGWTQGELSEKAGVSTDTIVRWEAGRGGQPHPRSLKRISAALGVHPSKLLSS